MSIAYNLPSMIMTYYSIHLSDLNSNYDIKIVIILAYLYFYVLLVHVL